MGDGTTTQQMPAVQLEQLLERSRRSTLPPPSREDSKPPISARATVTENPIGRPSLRLDLTAELDQGWEPSDG